MTETMTLWRPTGPEELDLVRASGWKAWLPRLPDQPIFYPVLNEQYAIMIARDWNVPASGIGYVTRFDVPSRAAYRLPYPNLAKDMVHTLSQLRADLSKSLATIVTRLDAVAGSE